MGNKNIAVDAAPSDEDARTAVSSLMGIQHQLTFAEIEPLIDKIMLKIRLDWPRKNENLSKPLVNIFLHPFYRDKMLQLFNLLRGQLKYIYNHKSFLFVSRNDWRYAKFISEFIMVFTNERLRAVVNTLPERIRKGELSESLSLELDGQNPNIPNIFQSFSKEQIREDIEIFRDLMFYSLKLKQNPIGRSAVANSLIYGMTEPLFSIFLKLFLITEENDTETLNCFCSQNNFTRNIISCTYIIGYSLEHETVSTIEMAIMMIQALIQKHNEEDQKLIEQVPSHAFNKLPVMACANIFEQILTLLLYGLAQLTKVQQEQNKKAYFTHKYKFSRIKALRLVTKLVKKYNPTNKESLFYLEILCKQTGARRIQRYQLLMLADTYVSITKKTTTFIQSYLRKYKKEGLENSQVSETELQSTTSEVIKKPKKYQIDGVDPTFIHNQISKIISNPLIEYEAFSEKLIYENLCNINFVEDPTEKLIWPLLRHFFSNISSGHSSQIKEVVIEEYSEQSQPSHRREKEKQIQDDERLQMRKQTSHTKEVMIQDLENQEEKIEQQI